MKNYKYCIAIYNYTKGVFAKHIHTNSYLKLIKIISKLQNAKSNMVTHCMRNSKNMDTICFIKNFKN